MTWFDYVQVLVHNISKNIMKQYNFASLIVNDFLLVEILKGIYGILRFSKLAQVMTILIV